MGTATRLTGRISRISRSAVHDGPGVRTVVFLQGCPLRCTWCHSPETQSLDGEVLLLKGRCIACGTCVATCENGAAFLDEYGPVIDRARCALCGRCVSSCPSGARERAGNTMDVDVVMDAIRRDVPFYDCSGGGVTFSGGEPLLQPSFLMTLLERCRAEGIRTAVETCGHASRDIALRVLQYGPLVLYDVKLVDNNRHRVATGMSNAPILENLRELARVGADLVVRFPLVPGVTDDDENVTKVAALVASLGVRRVDVLPYHRAGLAKYERLGRGRRPDLVPAATSRDAGSAAALMRGFGLDVRVGGSA